MPIAAFAAALHCGVDGVAARASRELGSVWVEGAALWGDMLCIELCSASHAMPRRVLVHAESGVVSSEDPILRDALRTVNERAGASSPGPRRSLMSMCVALQREARLRMSDVWPRDLAERPLLSTLCAHGLQQLAQHPALAQCCELGTPAAYCRVLDGVAVTVQLLSNALVNPRWPVVASPVPHWLFAATRCDTPTALRTRLDDPPNEFDAKRLLRCIQDLPSLSQLHDSASSPASFAALMHAMPGDAAQLLFWLVCLAPVKLLRTSGALGGEDAQYYAVHGPWDADACRSRVAPRPEAGDAAAAVFDPPSHQWSEPLHSMQRYVDAAGRWQLWYHGTPSDNAYAAVQGGMRSMSGTRFEKNGSIFGAGVYCTNDAAIAEGFSTSKGECWDLRLRRMQPMRCRCVLVLDIGVVPTNKVTKGGDELVCDPVRAQVPSSCYLVVPDPRNIRVVSLRVLTSGPSRVSAAQPTSSPSRQCSGTFIIVMATVLAALVAILSQWRLHQGRLPSAV